MTKYEGSVCCFLQNKKEEEEEMGKGLRGGHLSGCNLNITDKFTDEY
jgi:hypothetical protein